MNICTAATDDYYSRLITLIGSIHRYSFDSLNRIFFFDLGMSPEHLAEISRFEKVSIVPLEKTNPEILTMLTHHEMDQNQRKVVGRYSFKPVAIRQTAALVDDFFWLDAGCYIAMPLDRLYADTVNRGHFFVECATVGWSATKFVIDGFKLTPELLAKPGLNSGMMGITKQIYEAFVLPAYECARDQRWFIDDGSAAGGIVAGRTDQTIFSALAALNGYEVKPRIEVIDHHSQMSPETVIFQARGRSDSAMWEYIRGR